MEWRRLYNGYFNEKGEFVRMPLLEAAKLLRIPKKSLDDYLGLLRDGHKLGYEFSQYIDLNVSHLRNFVKENKPPNPKPSSSKPQNSA